MKRPRVTRRVRRRFGSLSLGRRIGIVLVAAGFLLPIVGAWWASSQARDAVEDQVYEAQQAAVRGVLGRVDVGYNAAVRGISAAAERPGLIHSVVTGDAEGTESALENVATLGFYRTLTAYDANNCVIVTEPHGAAPSLSVDGAPPVPVASWPRQGPDGVEVVVRASFHDGGRVVGQLVGEIRFRDLVGGAEALQFDDGLNVSLVGDDGTILASANATSEGLPLSSPEALDFVRSGREERVSYFVPRAGYWIFATFENAPGRPWNGLAASPRDAVLAGATSLGHRLLVGGLVLAALTLIVAMLVARHAGSAERSLRQARAEVAARNAALEAANDDLAMYANAAAHDLKSPLITIRGFTDLAMQYDGDRLSHKGRDALESVHRGSDRMVALIDGMLGYSGAGNRQLEVRPIVTARLVAEVVESLHGAIEERDASIILGALPDVEGDPMLIRQLFQNVIENAVLYGDPDHPEVEVEGQVLNGMTRFVVHDNGEGVVETERDRIFVAFARGRAGARVAGAGIGLSLSRRVAERHGGAVHLDAHADTSGTTFVVELPTAATVGV